MELEQVVEPETSGGGGPHISVENAPFPGGAIRVVLADDVEAFTLMLRLMLDFDGRFEVVAAVGDGASAVRVCNDENPDVILLDMAMPVVDGREAIPKIRACSPETVIVVFSAFAPDQIERAVMALGADAYLEKNGAIANIASTVVRLVSVARTEAALR
jgi:DNA-binding NarL/FixJ family response regulator